MKCFNKPTPYFKIFFALKHFWLDYQRHDFYQDAVSTIGSCTLVQAGVVGKISSRDGRRQTRIIQGSKDCLRLYTINHHKRDKDGTAELRLGASVYLMKNKIEMCHGDEDFDHNNWFRAYVPEEEDGCYLNIPGGKIACSQTVLKVCVGGICNVDLSLDCTKVSYVIFDLCTSVNFLDKLS